LDEANRTVGDFGPSGLPTLDFMIIEIFNTFCKTNDCEVRRDIRAKMQAAGYKRYEGLVKNSDLYVHPKSTFQVPT